MKTDYKFIDKELENAISNLKPPFFDIIMRGETLRKILEEKIANEQNQSLKQYYEDSALRLNNTISNTLTSVQSLTSSVRDLDTFINDIAMIDEKIVQELLNSNRVSDIENITINENEKENEEINKVDEQTNKVKEMDNQNINQQLEEQEIKDASDRDYSKEFNELFDISPNTNTEVFEPIESVEEVNELADTNDNVKNNISEETINQDSLEEYYNPESVKNVQNNFDINDNWQKQNALDLQENINLPYPVEANNIELNNTGNQPFYNYNNLTGEQYTIDNSDSKIPSASMDTQNNTMEFPQNGYYTEENNTGIMPDDSMNNYMAPNPVETQNNTMEYPQNGYYTEENNTGIMPDDSMNNYMAPNPVETQNNTMEFPQNGYYTEENNTGIMPDDSMNNYMAQNPVETQNNTMEYPQNGYYTEENNTGIMPSDVTNTNEVIQDNNMPTMNEVTYSVEAQNNLDDSPSYVEESPTINQIDNINNSQQFQNNQSLEDNSTKVEQVLKSDKEGTGRAIIVNNSQFENLQKSKDMQEALLRTRGVITKDIVENSNKVLNTLANKEVVSNTAIENSPVEIPANNYYQANQAQEELQTMVQQAVSPTEPTNYVSINEQPTAPQTMEQMLDSANELYKAGYAEEAQKLYDKVSEMNKTLQQTQDASIQPQEQAPVYIKAA